MEDKLDSLSESSKRDRATVQAQINEEVDININLKLQLEQKHGELEVAVKEQQKRQTIALEGLYDVARQFVSFASFPLRVLAAIRGLTSWCRPVSRPSTPPNLTIHRPSSPPPRMTPSPTASFLPPS